MLKYCFGYTVQSIWFTLDICLSTVLINLLNNCDLYNTNNVHVVFTWRMFLCKSQNFLKFHRVDLDLMNKKKQNMSYNFMIITKPELYNSWIISLELRLLGGIFWLQKVALFSRKFNTEIINWLKIL